MELTATDVVGISRVVVKYICVGKVSQSYKFGGATSKMELTGK